MLNDKERLLRAEKQIEELLEAKKKIERQIEIRGEIEKFVKEQERGFFKYALDVFKLLVIIAALYTSGNKALDIPFIQAMIK